ncbi:MAG TPA: pyridoxal phosphate-dependent aminotransferase [Stellaceae bacterium]|jgi:arginine:pyruvate transaminase|nr:pyridoxal phosphate-dependent aminotransferase [Stellaceae bacterium]
MRFAPLVDRIVGRGVGTWDTHVRGRQLIDDGTDVILLTVGNPDQTPAATMVDATVAALRGGRTLYAPTIGYPALRSAIATRVAKRSGCPCGPDNVAVVPGAQGGLYAAVMCLAGADDEIILLEPIYATYEGIVGAAGAKLVTVPLDPDRGFHPDLDRLAAAITPKTRVIWINTPHNPTGAVFTADEMATIAALCRRHDLWLLSDEVYEDLAFARPHVGAWSLAGMAERTAIVSSLSKSHAAPAFRLGWVVAPPDLIRHMSNLFLSVTYGSPAFIQDGALAALSAELPEVAALHDDYKTRATLMCGILAEAPRCRVVAPEGGMFVLLDIRHTGLDAPAFADGLLESERVAVLPCDGFGASAEGHLRISLGAPTPRIEEAGRRIVRYAQRLAQQPPA